MDKSSWFDEIDPRKIAVFPLTTGNVLEDCRLDNAVASFMNESRDNPGNCKAVNLSSVARKLLELIYQDTIYSYLNGLIRNS